MRDKKKFLVQYNSETSIMPEFDKEGSIATSSTKLLSKLKIRSADYPERYSCSDMSLSDIE